MRPPSSAPRRGRLPPPLATACQDAPPPCASTPQDARAPGDLPARAPGDLRELQATGASGGGRRELPATTRELAWAMTTAGRPMLALATTVAGLGELPRTTAAGLGELPATTAAGLGDDGLAAGRGDGGLAPRRRRTAGRPWSQPQGPDCFCNFLLRT
jgi:hypothetical protein